MTSSNLKIRTRDVLQVIFAQCAGLIELRGLPGKEPSAERHRCFARPEDIGRQASFVEQHLDTLNLYFGPATRRDDSGGRAEDCLHLAVLFADLDFDAHDEAHLRMRLDSVPLAPTIVIHSGHGLHVYYCLDQPLEVDGRLESTMTGGPIKALLRRLARAIDGDLKCAEVARILRLPNTYNYKRSTPALVRVEQCVPSRRYALTTFESILPADPLPPPPPVIVPPGGFMTSDAGNRLARGRAYLATMGPAIQGQGGDQHTYRASCWLTIDLGLNDGDALMLLSEWNATCVPPWTSGELHAKVSHARRYGRHAIGAALLEHQARAITVRVRVS